MVTREIKKCKKCETFYHYYYYESGPYNQPDLCPRCAASPPNEQETVEERKLTGNNSLA